MLVRCVLALAALAAGGCVTSDPPSGRPATPIGARIDDPAPVAAPAAGRPVMTPAQAILAAAGDPARGIRGTFEFVVRNVGHEPREGGAVVYLNSERDYRDQRCLTVSLHPAVLMRAAWGASPEKHLLNQRIRVTGTARRVTVWFDANGVRTDRFYYQTHVAVTDPRQIEILPATRR